MAELVQLETAARKVGKSEVTVRRLIRAGKIPFERQKTLTGFIYLVDPDTIRAYYRLRSGGVYNENGEVRDDEDGTAVPIPESVRTPSGPVRVAVAGESGNPAEYWQKKAENYEEKYFHELSKHSETKGELGVWRGRAEQAQAMLLKLLPASSEVSVEATPEAKASHAPEREAVSSTYIVALITAIIAMLVVGGGILYLVLRSA